MGAHSEFAETEVTVYSDVGGKPSSSVQKEIQNRRKAAKMLIAVVGALARLQWTGPSRGVGLLRWCYL